MTAQMQAMLASGLALFALGPDPTKGTNLNILQLPGGGLSLDLMESVYGAQVKSLAKGAITSERVQLPVGEALHYTYDIPMQGMGSPVTIEQYMIPMGSNLLVVSITSADKTDAKSMAESIESIN